MPSVTEYTEARRRERGERAGAPSTGEGGLERESRERESRGQERERERAESTALRAQNPKEARTYDLWAYEL